MSTRVKSWHARVGGARGVIEWRKRRKRAKGPEDRGEQELDTLLGDVPHEALPSTAE